MVALPLALLSIGGTLTLKNLKSHLGHAFWDRHQVADTAARRLVFSQAFDASTLSFQVGMLFFALPTSPAIIVLSSQLNSDTEFASASIVVSTLLSFFSMSAVLLSF
jgi:malonate transporter